MEDEYRLIECYIVRDDYGLCIELLSRVNLTTSHILDSTLLNKTDNEMCIRTLFMQRLGELMIRK